MIRRKPGKSVIEKASETLWLIWERAGVETYPNQGRDENGRVAEGGAFENVVAEGRNRINVATVEGYHSRLWFGAATLPGDRSSNARIFKGES